MTDSQEIWDVAAPLLTALLLGGLLGLDREVRGRWAGLRTHMMVAMGAALFMLVCRFLPHGKDHMGHVLQGIAVGVGFIGAGTILKLTDRIEIKGLTTASSIWFAAAVGTAAGANMYLLACAGAVIGLLVLTVFGLIEYYCEQNTSPESGAKEHQGRAATQKPSQESD